MDRGDSGRKGGQQSGQVPLTELRKRAERAWERATKLFQDSEELRQIARQLVAEGGRSETSEGRVPRADAAHAPRQ
jgi:hypothetical protein